MNLEEQLDDMTVKASEDAANVHTLQIQVNTLEEGTNVAHYCHSAVMLDFLFMLCFHV